MLVKGTFVDVKLIPVPVKSNMEWSQRLPEISVLVSLNCATLLALCNVNYVFIFTREGSIQLKFQTVDNDFSVEIEQYWTGLASRGIALL